MEERAWTPPAALTDYFYAVHANHRENNREAKLPGSNPSDDMVYEAARWPVICYYYQVDPLADQNADEEWENEDEDDDEE